MLNLGQAESLVIGFSMNLVLTAWMYCTLAAVMGMANWLGGGRTALFVALQLNFPPLCGGNGLSMLPSLLARLCDYVARAW
jgi:hypothetical protein